MANIMKVLDTSLFSSLSGLLQYPGDSFSARITGSNRKVLNVIKDGKKYSVTEYPNGTRFFTLSIPAKKH